MRVSRIVLTKNMRWGVWLGLSISYTTFAASIHDRILSAGWSPVLTLAAGAGFAGPLAKTQYITVPDTAVIYTFQPAQDTPTRLLLGVYAAFERAIIRDYRLQLGVSYFQPLSYQVTGAVSVPHVQNVSQYSYNLTLQQLLAEARFVYQHEQFLPYISGGVGVGWIETGSFSTNFPGKLSFGTLATSNVNYSVGAGMDFKVCPGARVGVGYRFMSLGQYSTAHGKTTLSSGLPPLFANDIYVNALVLQISFTEPNAKREPRQSGHGFPED